MALTAFYDMVIDFDRFFLTLYHIFKWLQIFTQQQIITQQDFHTAAGFHTAPYF